MAVSLKTELRFPNTGLMGHGDRNIHFGIRLDEETADILKAYCDKHNISKGEAIRQAITKLNETAK